MDYYLTEYDDGNHKWAQNDLLAYSWQAAERMLEENIIEKQLPAGTVIVGRLVARLEMKESTRSENDKIKTGEKWKLN